MKNIDVCIYYTVYIHTQCVYTIYIHTDRCIMIDTHTQFQVPHSDRNSGP